MSFIIARDTRPHTRAHTQRDRGRVEREGERKEKREKERRRERERKKGEERDMKEHFSVSALPTNCNWQKKILQRFGARTSDVSLSTF